MLNRYKANLLGILTGIMLSLAFPPMPVSYFAFVAFIPLIFALEERKDGKVFLLLYTTFFLYNLITNWWVGSWQSNADPFLMLSGLVLVMAHPFFFLAPLYVYLSIRKRYSLSTALWVFPFIWTGFEWLHSVGDLSYPWLSVGYTQVYNHLWIQFADIAGVWGIGFVIVLINILIARILFIYLGKTGGNRHQMADYISQSGFFTSFRMTGMIIAISILIILPYIYGIIRVQDFKYEEQLKSGRNFTIGIIQPSINPWAKWAGGVNEQIELHIHIQDSLKHMNPEIDLMLWSETAIPFLDFNFNSEHNFDFLRRWSTLNNSSIISGLADVHLYKKEEEIPKSAKLLTGTKATFYDSYNAAMIINPGKRDKGIMNSFMHDRFANKSIQVYHKMRLTPFSERLPFAEYISFARGWLEWGVGISSWQKGAKQFPLIMRKGSDSIKVGTVICIESIYPDYTRKYIEQGAEFLVVITNDAWFDHTFGPEQHFAISQMRAVETRRYIARCANSGLSGFISPTGKRLKLLPQYKSIGGAFTLPALNGKSVYVKIGDVLPYICAIISVFFLVFGFFKRRVK